MTDTRKRSVHLPEFKAKVGLEAVRGVKTIKEIAQNYGEHPVQVSQWKREIQDQAKTLFEGKRGPQPEVFNSDQRVQFTSEVFTGVLNREEITISMDGRMTTSLWKDFGAASSMRMFI